MFQYMRRGRSFYREVAALAAPMVLQNLLTNTLSMADTFMVGLLGQTPMAGLTLANVPLYALQVFFIGVQSGAAVLISQFWGKGDREAVSRVIGLHWYVAGAASAALAAVLLFAPEPFLSLFGNDPAVIAEAARYGRIVGVSYIFNGFALVHISAHRSTGNVRPGLYILVTSMLINTALNWVLIFGNLGAPALGVEGAALATLISRAAECGLALIHIRTSRHFRLNLALALRPGTAMLRKVARYSFPVMLNELLWGLGASIYVTIMGHMQGSEEILAAYTITGNITNLCSVATGGLCGSAAIIIGREIGAGRGKTVYDVGRALTTLAAAILTAVAALLLACTLLWFPSYLFPLFHLSPGAVRAGMIMMVMRIVCMPLFAYTATCIVGVLRGGGDVRAALVIDDTPMWLVAIPLAALAGLVLKLDIFWVYLAASTEQMVKIAICVHRVRSGKWIHDVTTAER